MKAIAITPGKGEARIEEIGEPGIIQPDDVKLEVLEVGICGTDREEVEGGRADAPKGEKFLVIGHEMIGRVSETGGSVRKVKKGDLAVIMVRRPCNKCEPCHNNRSDMCSTGQYDERGIKGLHGFQTEFVVDSEKYLIKVPPEISDIGVLTEPMSVVEKAISESLKLQAARLPEVDPSTWLNGRKALVAGLGPVGLLAAFILHIRGAHIYGMDIVDEDSPRAKILKQIGGEYINGTRVDAIKIDDTYGRMNFILEATGIAKLEFQLMDALDFNGIYVLTGIPAGERPLSLLGSELMRKMVLMNQLMFGSVNAAINHYEQAVSDLVLIRNKNIDAVNNLITERVPYQKFMNALAFTSEEIKTVVQWKDH
jgi:threonine dehydrogenase-like Zn-dependent dehydrogenase